MFPSLAQVLLITCDAKRRVGIYIYIYICVCVCVCVLGRERTYRSGAVPGDHVGAADEAEVRDLALRLPAVLGDETVRAVGAGDGGEGAGGVVVAGVIGDFEFDC